MHTPVADVPPVNERFKVINNSLKKNKNEADKVFPGFAELMQKYVALSDDESDIDTTEFLRELLRVFRNSHDEKIKSAYRQNVEVLSHNEQKRIEEFAKGARADEAGRNFKHFDASPAARNEMQEMEKSPPMRQLDLDDLLNGKGDHEEGWVEWLKDKVEKVIGKEDTKVYQYARFVNWGRTVNNVPEYTFVPKKVIDVKNIVKFAKSRGLSVRCSGYRHSWVPVFSEKGQILISMLDLARVENIPDLTALGFYDLFDRDDEPLEKIAFADKGFSDQNTRLVRVGTATTNETLRRFCIANDVTMPSNPVGVEMTLGGTNAPMCHGAGRAHQTLSDLVRRIDYVDAHGEKRHVDDPRKIKAAGGCFGLIGVVTHLTLELPKMMVAKMYPIKVPVAFAVPPPDDYVNNIPATLAAPWKALEDNQKREKQEDFERRAKNDYYSEWFWFPLSDYSWVNTWSPATSKTDIEKAIDYPSTWEIFQQLVETVLINILQNIDVINKLIDMLDLAQPVTTLLSRLAMKQLPANEEILCYLPDALHFQRGIQNVRLRNFELEIPLEPKPSKPDDPDFLVMQKAWWDAIIHLYKKENLKTCPQRFPLEMRIMGGSDMIMAAQRGNNLGTGSIEVVTMHSQAEIWPRYAQELVDIWMKDRKAKIRPHWAKEWKEFTIDGKPWIDKLKNEDYKTEIEEFKQTLAEIGKNQKWTLKDLKERFSNDMFNELIFFDIK